MPKRLTVEQVDQYRRDGYVCPVRVMDQSGATGYRRILERFESEQGGPVSGALRNKCHLLFRWVDELMRNEAILDAVEDLIGENILCWNTLFWIKEPQTKSYVSWHQDLNYWGLDTDDLITVWLALSPATPESGCMSVLPGSHRGEFMPHSDTFQEDNMLTRGQEITVEVDEAETVSMPLRPGEISMHNGRLAHASSPNTSEDRRIGILVPLHADQDSPDHRGLGQRGSGPWRGHPPALHPHAPSYQGLRPRDRGIPRQGLRSGARHPVPRRRQGTPDPLNWV